MLKFEIFEVSFRYCFSKSTNLYTVKAKQKVSNETIDKATSNQQWGEKEFFFFFLIQLVLNLTSWYQADHYWVLETTVSGKYEARYSENEKTENWKEVGKKGSKTEKPKRERKKSHNNWIIYLKLRFWLPY